VAASLKDVLGTGHPIQVSRDPEAYVRLNAAVMTVAALLLSAGKLPRLSSAVLAGSLVPTTLAGHRFWEVKDPAERAAQRRHFLKNVGLIGGLILATVDTEGRPGLSWRVHHAADDTRRQVRRARKVARVSAKAAAHATRDLGSHLPG
jgi:putative oxidoreductase